VVSASPLLVARQARISVDDSVAIPSFDLETKGRRLVLAGGVGPLFAALSNIPLGAADAARAAARDEIVDIAGRARASAGELLLVGRDVSRQEHLAFVGAAPLDPPAAAEWSLLEYVVTSTRLALAARGSRASGAETTKRSQAALDLVGLGAGGKRPIQSLTAPERRVLVLAAAAAADPEVIVAERPLAGLEDQAAAFVMKAMEAVFETRFAVITVDRLAAGTPEGAFTRRASDVALFFGGELGVFGSPADVLRSARLYRVVVASNADLLRAALSERGLVLEGGPTQFSLATTEEASVSDVLRVASEVRSAVVEIVPLM